MPKILGKEDEAKWLMDFSVRMDSLDTVAVGFSFSEGELLNFFQIYNEGWAESSGNHDLSLQEFAVSG